MLQTCLFSKLLDAMIQRAVFAQDVTRLFLEAVELGLKLKVLLLELANL